MTFEILITLFLVLLNGFFVAAEFAIVKVRYSQIEIRAIAGDRIAKTSRNILNHLDAYLSATQLGITLASLGLGWTGEPVVAKIIVGIFNSLDISISPELTHHIALPVAFIVITVLHIVFGELVPKSIAIRKPESTTLLLSMPLKLFFVIFRPFIWTLDRISNLTLMLIGIAPADEHESHSPDELRLLMKQSKDSGAIKEDNYEIIKNAFDFTDHIAKHIMVPRQQIFALELSTPPQEIIHSVIENGYSRIPVYQESLDNIAGVVFAKDIFNAYVQNQNFNLKDLLHPVQYVFQNRKINTVLREFQKKHIHIAIVIDEYGGTDGIISLEDILEELVGEIQDEYDDEKPIVEKVDDNTYNVYATALLEDINTYLPRPLPEPPKYITLSGLIIYHCNRIPKAHEKMTVEDYEITILKRQRNSIMVAQLKDLKPPEKPPDIIISV